MFLVSSVEGLQQPSSTNHVIFFSLIILRKEGNRNKFSVAGKSGKASSKEGSHIVEMSATDKSKVSRLFHLLAPRVAISYVTTAP